VPELFFDELELFFTDGRSTLVRLVWLIDGIVRDLYGGAEWTQVTIMRQQVNQILVRMQIWKDNHGQDLIEYALMAGFVAVSAGAIMPGVASSVSTIFSKVGSVLKVASTQGS
jgi:pilus assembly protein Flp/PilA